MGLTEEQELDLRTTLKRCSQKTIESAVTFRKNKNIGDLEALVRGIIERYAEDKETFAQAPETARLIEDLGFDSLTIMEIVVTIEEVTDIRIDNEEVQGVKSLADVKKFVASKLGLADDKKKGSGGDGGKKSYSKDDIMLILPQSHPFLFVDEAMIDGDMVHAKYHITGDEHFLEGHFKDNPVFPASIVFEALGQAGCLWLLEQVEGRTGKALGSHEVVFASMEGAHFYRRALPGDTLEMEIKLASLREPLGIFSGAVTVKGEKLAAVEKLMLAFGAQAAEHLKHA